MSTSAAATETFLAHRNLLFTVAYEMLGSAADADDVLQETWLRWTAVDTAEVREPHAYLVRITTRQALDRLRSVKRRRESYVGSWLPEPLRPPPRRGAPPTPVGAARPGAGRAGSVPAGTGGPRHPGPVGRARPRRGRDQ
ncbi:putative sigma factor [Nocardia farcinica IFM 10152]|uniref:Putative sigma factor n=1 Tax=Nocardia farcinica (strain IFM 10152) TaxID=247156 RepID=Q5YVY4_NOCFA|nr:putative sigma factor [Nocardia farcinica IFM 10152]